MHLLSLQCLTSVLTYILHVALCSDLESTSAADLEGSTVEVNEIRKQADVSPAVLYDTGVKDYLDNNFDGCAQKLEQAVDVYNQYMGILRRCYLQCHHEVRYEEPLNYVDVENLLHYERAIKNTLCLLKCKKNKGITDVWNMIDAGVIQTFEKRRPFEYLHACYAATNNFQQAANAAFTYLAVNPNDAGMLASLQHYAQQPGVDVNDIINREAKDYVYLYVHGSRAYDDKHWDGVIQNMEASLESYLQEEEECRAQCEGPFEQPPNDFIPSVANHFAHVLVCKRKCHDKLSTLNGEKNDDLLPSHYHYLQFTYFKLGKLKEACEAVASYLLFYPEDKTMMHNLEYYLTLPKVEQEFFKPRPEALTYIQRDTYEKKIMDYINNVYVAEIAKLYQSDNPKLEVTNVSASTQIAYDA